MTIQEMKHIINTQIPFDSLEKNSGIYEFYEVGDISIGVSYETNEEGNDRYVFNLFHMQDEYINIYSTGNNDETIRELVEEWNNLLNT